MPAPVLRANADYLVIDRSPLTMEAGQQVALGGADRIWPGWVYVTAADGRATYVPETCLEITGPDSARVTSRFDATDLSVRKGEHLASLREIAGWHWCRNAQGAEGWVPAYVLDVETEK